MISFFIDTSASDIIVALLKEDQILIQKKEKNDHSLSTRIMPLISLVFEETKIEPGDVNRIFVVNGPGSFTGIRVGVTIAKVMAWTLKIPIIPVSRLHLMATTPVKASFIVSMIDARRSYVYAGVYDENRKCIGKDLHLKLETVVEKMKNRKNIVYICDEEIELKKPLVKPDPDIRQIVRLYIDHPGVPPHELKPNYLKKTEAEENLKKEKHDSETAN